MNKRLTPLETFGSRVRDLRRILRISQEELGFRAHLSKNYISDVERGRRNVSLKTIYALAKGLGVEVEDLFIK